MVCFGRVVRASQPDVLSGCSAVLLCVLLLLEVVGELSWGGQGGVEYV